MCECQCFEAAGISLKSTQECDTTEFQINHVGHVCFALRLVKRRLYGLKQLLNKYGWKLKHDDVKLSKIVSELDVMETALATYAGLFQEEASRQLDPSDSDSDGN